MKVYAEQAKKRNGKQNREQTNVQDNSGQKELFELVCNKCGKKLKVENGMLKEGVFEAKQNFGYFSYKDGRTHEFDLCEACYDELIATFAIPVTQKEEFEWQID